MVCSIGPGIDEVDSASTADVVRKLNAQKNWFSKGFAPKRLIVVRQKGKAVGEVSAVIMAETAAKIELRFTRSLVVCHHLFRMLTFSLTAPLVP